MYMDGGRRREGDPFLLKLGGGATKANGDSGNLPCETVS